ncbi:hypothetical protein Tco_0007074 [Tanacetum coccineum]
MRPMALVYLSQSSRLCCCNTLTSVCNSHLCCSPQAKVDSGCLAAAVAELFQDGMSASRMISLWVGDGSNGGDGILGNGNDSGNSGDGDGVGDIDAATHLSISASMDDGRGV